MINIPKHIIDPFYRYQRPKVIIEKAKLGIRFLNINEIAKAIELSDKSIMKFLQKKNGCKAKNNILFSKTITDNILDDQLEELLNKLICKLCNNPEFEIYSEKEKNFIKCKACGNEDELNEELAKIMSYELESKPSKKNKTLEEELNNFNFNILDDPI